MRIKSELIVILLSFMYLVSVSYASTCANNWQSGNCIGNIVYTQNTILSGNVLLNGSVTVNPTVWLTLNGYFIADNGTWTNNGFVTGGKPYVLNVIYPYPTNGISSEGITNHDGTDGRSFLSSNAGGGSAGGSVGTACSGNGGSTKFAGGLSQCGGASGGAGHPSALPTVTNANIAYWIADIYDRMSSGGGGGASGSNGCQTLGNCASAGMSVYGGYVQTNSVQYVGNFVFNGIAGGADGAGASGGGFAVFASNQVMTGNIFYAFGGKGGQNVNGQVFATANGGNGIVANYIYVTQPVVTPSLTSVILTAKPNPVSCGLTSQISAYSTALDPYEPLELLVNGSVIRQRFSGRFNYTFAFNGIGLYNVTVIDLNDTFSRNTLTLNMTSPCFPSSGGGTISNAVFSKPDYLNLDSLLILLIAIVFGCIYTFENSKQSESRDGILRFVSLVICITLMAESVLSSFAVTSSTYSGGITTYRYTPSTTLYWLGVPLGYVIFGLLAIFFLRTLQKMYDNK